MTKGEKRDVTRALAIVKRVSKRGHVVDSLDVADLVELTQILQNMDARTGRRDPSKRKHS